MFAESGVQFDATLVFICWAGEEQGLVGSAAARAATRGRARRRRSRPQQRHRRQQSRRQRRRRRRDGPRLLGRARGLDVARAGPLRRALAAVYVPSHRIRLMAREDRFGRGSDHSSFTQQGYPAIVFREANENFSKQHTRRRHARRRGLRVPGAERAGERRRGRVAGAGAAGPEGDRRPRDRTLITRGKSGYDAHASVAGVTGRGRLSHLLARHVELRLAASRRPSAT